MALFFSSPLQSTYFFFTLMTTKKTIEINDLFVSLFYEKSVSKLSLTLLLLIQTNKQEEDNRTHAAQRMTMTCFSRLWTPLLLSLSQLSERYFSLSFFLIWLHYFSLLPPFFCYFEIQKKNREIEENTPILCAYTQLLLFLPLVAQLLERWTDSFLFLLLLLFCSSFAYYYSA